jgi:hypothetical protein
VSLGSLSRRACNPKLPHQLFAVPPEWVSIARPPGGVFPLTVTFDSAACFPTGGILSAVILAYRVWSFGPEEGSRLYGRQRGREVGGYSILSLLDGNLSRDSNGGLRINLQLAPPCTGGH